MKDELTIRIHPAGDDELERLKGELQLLRKTPVSRRVDSHTPGVRKGVTGGRWGRVAGALVLIACVAFPGSAGVRAASPAAGGAAGPCLILHDWGGKSPAATPTFIRENKAFLESLPFDGVAVYLRNPDGSENLTTSLMSNQRLGYAVIAKVLDPLKGMRFSTLTQNFAAVFSGRPPDFFGDWSIVIQNFADLARAAREAGLKGIYFDNENHAAPWSHYPVGVDQPNRTLKEYQAQARLRGRQTMEAMVAQFPDIIVISLHGPYLSEPKAPAPLFPQVQSKNQLMGPFFCGFVEGAGKLATCVDGGRLYHLRDSKEFQESYDWRKRGIASDRVNSEFIPNPLRPLWPAKVNVGFGIYSQPFDRFDMFPDILRPTIATALRQTDRYVWLHVDGLSFLKPPKSGGASEVWVDAVRQGRSDGMRKVSRR